MTKTAVYLVAAGAVLAALLYASRRGGDFSASGIGYDIGTAAFDVVDGVVSGAVVSTGAVIGVPKTDLSECERAKAEGRTWDASFACPAGNFLSYVFS